MSSSHQPRIFTRQFNTLLAGNLLFFLSFNMLLAEFPEFLSKLGGESYKGLIIGIFTISAAFSRPYSGKLADHIGRKPVIFLGLLMGILCSSLYGFTAGVMSFLMLRFLHGFAVGFTPTGTNALLADIVPAERRGESAGIMGLTLGIGMSLGPFVGSTIAGWHSWDAMFVVSSLLGLSAFLILYRIEETLPKARKFHFSLLKIKTSEIYEPRVTPVFVTMLFMSYAFGAVLTITPDFSQHTGLADPKYLFGWGNKAIFMTVFTFSSIFIRLLSGKVSDRYGRPQLLVWGNSFVVAAMLLLALSEVPEVILFAAVLYGIGVGTNGTTISAWTIDLSHPQHRGRAVATQFISLEVGIGTGAMVSGLIYGNNPANFMLVFSVCMVMNLICILYLLSYMNRNKVQIV